MRSSLGLVYVAGFALLGPWALSVWLGPGYQLDRAYLAVLAAASSGMFVAVVLQAGLGALDQWPRIAASWLAGAVAFGVTLVLPVSTLWRASAAPLAAVLTALAVMWWLGRSLWVESAAGQTRRRIPSRNSLTSARRPHSGASTTSSRSARKARTAVIGLSPRSQGRPA